jgi:hypothetical protein
MKILLTLLVFKKIKNDLEFLSKNVHMKNVLIKTIFLLLLGIGQPLLFLAQSTKYAAENGTIIGKNTGRYNNRPLYINNTNAFILTGDQPIARLAKEEYLYGTFMLAIERNGKGKWLQQCSQITSIYRPGRMAWEITDTTFPGLKITLEILPMATRTGMAVRVNAVGVRREDKLIWTFGGAQWRIWWIELKTIMAGLCPAAKGK